MTFAFTNSEDAARGARLIQSIENPTASSAYRAATLRDFTGTKKFEDTTLGSSLSFLASMGSAGTTELIGFDPPDFVERWRQKHPILGLASEMVGVMPSFSIPYVGQSMLGLKLLETTKLGKKAVMAASRMESLGKSPFLQGAAMEALRWTPFEAGKLTASVLASPFGASPYNVAKHVALELPFVAGLGGGRQFLASRKGTPTPDLSRMEGVPLATKEIEIAKAISPRSPYRINAQPQEKVAYLDDLISQPEFANDPDIQALRDWYSHVVRWEEAGKVKLPGMGANEYIRTGYGRHVQEISSKSGAAANKRATERANSLYVGGGGVESVKLVVGEGGFDTAAQLDEAYAGIGLLGPKGWEGVTQFPRQLFFNERGAKKLQKFLDEDMQRMYAGINRDVWITKETRGNNLWFAVARVRPEETAFRRLHPTWVKPVPWKYYMFKTSEPHRFAPGVESLLETQKATFRHITRSAFRGLPETEEDAARLAEHFREIKMKVPEDPLLPRFKGIVGETFDPDNPEHLSYLMSRKRPHDSFIPTIVQGEETYKAVEPGHAGLVMTAPERVVASAGLKESRYIWVRYFDKFLSDKARRARQDAARILGEHGFLMKNALAPAMADFVRSPRAVSMWAFTRHMYDYSQERAVAQLVGEPLDLTGRNMLKHFVMLKPMPRKGGLIDEIRPAFSTPEGEEQFWRSWLEALSPAEARSRKYKNEVVNALSALQRVDRKNINELQFQRMMFGYQDNFEPMDWHYMISRTWVGNYRFPLRDAETEQIYGYASGWNSGGALKEAREIVARVNKEFEEAGNPFRLKEIPEDAQAMERAGLQATKDWEPELSAFAEDLFSAARDMPTMNPISRAILRTRTDLIMNDPARFQHRLGKIGFAGEAKPLSFRDVKNRIYGNVIETHKLLAREATWGFMRDDLHRLSIEDAALTRRFIRRWNLMQGIQGDITRSIEKSIDKVLAPLFGAGAGSRISAAFNEATFFLTLGAVDLGFAALNAMTPIQTVLPELSFLMTAPPERLMGYYSFNFALTPKGIQSIGFLEPMKILAKSFKIMANPDKEWGEALRRAVDGGVMSRQFVETAVGHDSKIMRDMLRGKLVSGEETVFRNILNALQAPIAASEEFSRGLSFIAGRMVGKDFFGLEGEQLWLLAKDVALRTNYGYRTFDRAPLITGAVGTGWGLFKNWTWHYTTNLLGAYSEEALQGNFLPLLWAGLGTGSVAGAMGIPGYGIANYFSKTFSDESLTQHVYELLGNDADPDSGRPIMADTFLYGFPSLLGVSLQGRASAPGAEVLRDTQMFLNTAHLQRAIGLFNVFKNGWELAKRGINPVDSHNFNRSLWQAFAPRTAQRAYASLAKEGLISLQTGNRVMPSPSTMQTIAYTFGVSPIGIEKRLDAHNELYEKVENMRNRIQFYGDLLAQSVMAGGRVPYAEVINRAMYEDVPLDSILRSYKSRVAREQADLIDHRWNLITRWRLQQTRGLY